MHWWPRSRPAATARRYSKPPNSGYERTIAVAHIAARLNRISEGMHNMAAVHEVARLAARSRAVMEKLGTRAAQLNARLDSVENRSESALGSHSAMLDAVERDIRVMEDMANQLGNNPPLEGSPGNSLGPPDTNGVRLNQTGD